jgi:hypothetical protein
MGTKILVLACTLTLLACTPEENGGALPDVSNPEPETATPSSPSLPDGGGPLPDGGGPLPHGSGQPPPGHGGPNPGWGGALPPGWGHTTPPGQLGDAGTPTWHHKDAPTIISYSQSHTWVRPGDTVSFQIAATDPNGLPLTYSWWVTQGYLSVPTSPAGPEATWTAPFIDDQVTVTVRVENSFGLPDIHTFHVHTEVDLSTAVFVSPNGSDSNPGSTTAPYASVQQAINAAAAGSATHVVLAAGTYRETIRLPSHISLWGQYDPVTWSHTPTSASILDSPTRVGIFVSDIVPASLSASSPGAQFQCVQNSAGSGSIQGLLIASSHAGREQSSLAVLLNNVSGTFTVQNNLLQAGAGGHGLSAGERGDVCGGPGGGWGRPGAQGCSADTGAAGGAPGQGGSSWGEWGTRGGDGQDGVSGIIVPNQSEGQLSGSACGGPPSFNWQALGGTQGTGGSGGGGGGGGATGLCCLPAWPPQCAPWPAGNGGHGGTGGRGGNGGSGAGGSFGIVILDSAGTVVARNNLIVTANGGTGGAGSSARLGTPGQGGQPGAPCLAGSGGNGGDGGRGGNGGGGSGGAGGMSVGILLHNSPNLDVGVPVDTNVYTLAPAGAGGAGGWPAPGGMPGILSSTYVLP